jgi:Flp pilus assembly protein TadD
MFLFSDGRIAFMAALLFAVHPSHVPSVSYISGRADLLFFFFGFLSLLMFVYYRKLRTVRPLLYCIFFFGLSLLSKEHGLIFLVLIPLTDLVFFNRFAKKEKNGYLLLLLIVAGAYLSARFFLSGRIFPGVSSGVDVSAFLGLLGKFVLMSIFPAGIHMRGSLSSISGFYTVLYSLVFFAGVLIYLSLGRKRRTLSYALLFFFISVLPLLWAAKFTGMVAQHWVYLPVFGMMLFVSTALTGFYERSSVKKKSLVMSVLFFGVFFYTRACIAGAGSFSSDKALSDAVSSGPGDISGGYFRAVANFREGSTAEALSSLQRVTERSPENCRGWYLSGRMYLSSGMTERAGRAFKRSLQLCPGYSNAFVGMALIEFQEGRNDRAIEYLEKALISKPGHPEASTLLEMAYFEAGREQEAFDLASRVLSLNPYNYDNLMNMGTMLTRKGRLYQGATYYMKASRLYPERPGPYYNLANVFHISGDVNNAVKFATKAVLADPGYQPAIKLLKEIKSRNK